MKFVQSYQYKVICVIDVGVFIANFEQISHIVQVVDFEQINTRGHQIWQGCTSRGIDSNETNETGAGDIINS